MEFSMEPGMVCGLVFGNYQRSSRTCRNTLFTPLLAHSVRLTKWRFEMAFFSFFMVIFLGAFSIGLGALHEQLVPLIVIGVIFVAIGLIGVIGQMLEKALEEIKKSINAKTNNQTEV
jgi:hypothetical protein